MIVSTGACVNLGKPEKVAECAANNTCVNSSKVLDGGATGSDANTFIDGQKPDSRAPGLDGRTTNDDTTPTTGPDVPDIIPDTATDPAVTPTQEVGPGQPDLPRDQPADQPVTTDGPADAAPDARDAPRDVAVGICAPGGVVQPAGTSCRKAVGLCDIEETCDGVNADCPADKLAAAGTSCRAIAGDCDIAETCSGTSADCPVDGFKQAGTVCRAAVTGGCDVAESCIGASAACPVDSLASSSTVCRASTDSNKCDPAENCTGLSTTCPTNVIYTLPTVPGGVAVATGTQSATISWNAAAGATGYNVKRSTTNGSGYTSLGSTPTTSASPYLNSGLAAGTYYYVVSSINTIATCQSTNSSQVTANVSGPCTPPAAPSVTATPGNNTVGLSWAAVTGAVSYSVARSQSTGTGYVTLGSPTPANGTTYTDSQVVNGTTYYYVVTASNGTCSSGNSTEVSAAPACTPPNAPTVPTATATINSVTLTWNAAATATTYLVKRSTTSGSGYVLLQNVGVTTFTDTAVVTGTTYYYVVAASNGFCSSADSPQVAVTPTCVPPSAPTSVLATPNNGLVTLSWSAPAGATSYLVYRGTTSGGESTTALATPSTTNYTDNSVTNGTTYYYKVAASNGSCASVNSAEASTTPVCTPPSAPGTLTTTPGDAQVSLSWVATTSWGSAGTDTYSISRKTGAGGTYAVIVAAQAGTSYTDRTGLTNGTTYYYKVSASNGSCSSAFDTEVPATPIPSCSQGAPGTPILALTSTTQVQVTWTASSPVPTGGYDIGRSTTSGSGYTNVGHVGNTTLTFTDTSTSLAVGTTYYYEVTANGSCTAASAPASIAFACQTPGVPSPSASNSAGAITITWSTTTGATAYTVYRSTSSGGTYTAISSNQTALNYTDPAGGLTNGTTYYYKVSASNANHQCASAQSSATSAMSCTTPSAPTGLSATRAGNKAVKLVWTNSSGANLYNVLRSTTSGSGYASIGTTASSPFTDTNAANGTVFYYVATAISDAGGNCTPSGNSSQVSVPTCTVFTGGTNSSQEQGQTAQWCLVTCDNNISWWGFSGAGDRTLYINAVQTGTSGAMPLPAQVNSGYAFYFTASANGSGNYTYWNYGGGTSRACP
jgi:fibronectin type 3 domain-containing protein